MGLFGTIFGSIRRPQELGQLPFEVLVEEHASRPKEVHHEFVNRLLSLVFQAAQAHLIRQGRVPSELVVGPLTQEIFTQFAPEFTSGQPEMVLVRFASTIRTALGDAAFRQIAPRFYAQIPVYHIEDDEQRKFLAAAYQEGLPPDMVERLAKRFCVSHERCKSIIVQANASYRHVIANDFNPAELRRMTEGFLS